MTGLDLACIGLALLLPLALGLAMLALEARERRAHLRDLDAILDRSRGPT